MHVFVAKVMHKRVCRMSMNQHITYSTVNEGYIICYDVEIIREFSVFKETSSHTNISSLHNITGGRKEVHHQQVLWEYAAESFSILSLCVLYISDPFLNFPFMWALVFSVFSQA